MSIVFDVSSITLPIYDGGVDAVCANMGSIKELTQTWLFETIQIKVFRELCGKGMDEMASNLACSCITTTFRLVLMLIKS